MNAPASTSSLPAPDAVARVLRELFDRGMAPKKSTLFPTPAKAYLATYLDDKDAILGVVVCDIALASSMGSALALIPPGAAADAAKAGKLPPEMLDNFREVLNILHRQFGDVHVRFRDLVQPGEKIPAGLAAVLAKPAARLDLEWTLTGYSGGRLTFLLA